MNELTRIGVDVAKQVFQVHGVDRHEQPVWRRRLSRDRWLRAVVEAAPPGVKSAWRRAAVHTIGRDNCRLWVIA